VLTADRKRGFLMIRTLALRPFARLALVAALALALTGLAVALAPSTRHHDMAAAASRADRSSFHDAMRVLWEDHIVWTRMAIISIVDDRPDQSFAVERLLRNQDDIGNAIKPFYGEAAGNALTALLREHIVGAADLLVAAQSGVGFSPRQLPDSRVTTPPTWRPTTRSTSRSFTWPTC
jgi:hypothetical protein